MADGLLIDKIGLEDYMAADFERSLQLRHQRSLEVVKIHNEVIGIFWQLDLLQISRLPCDRQVFFVRALARGHQSHRRDIDRNYFKASFRQKYGITSLARGDVQRPAGLD